jgi:hypothetical protein
MFYNMFWLLTRFHSTAPHRWWWWWMWSSRWNENWRGTPKCSKKTCPSDTNPTWPELGSNPGRGGKPANNRLSYGTAQATPLTGHTRFCKYKFRLRLSLSSLLRHKKVFGISALKSNIWPRGSHCQTVLYLKTDTLVPARAVVNAMRWQISHSQARLFETHRWHVFAATTAWLNDLKLRKICALRCETPLPPLLLGRLFPPC